MKSVIAHLLANHPHALAIAMIIAQSATQRRAFLHMLLHFGVAGVFFIAIVDVALVPLPIPGITDIIVIVLTAQHMNWFLLILLATAGSTVGAYINYLVGRSGGLAFLEKRISPRIFKTVTSWMERHNILAIALPTILPPPMPLSPFLLAAGLLKMPRKKFLATFTISRALRNATAVWLGIHYGRTVIRLWNHISDKYAAPILITLWAGIVISCAYAFWKLYKTSRTVGILTTTKAAA